ncbi:hypothetical protein ACFOLL_12490 [Falsochrobactrum ovis]|uniref:DUF7768 domain-containing protein n=1 Tax=Falsochrobactrum ovis TaxID=1293442 RepID=A0A364JSU9_9HYPH|nr:hypothetical protein [Falsochrobactrum ovis]RAK26402.1 hypothetical protein C7374_11488 [Falsochrobactrum ovis]
MVFSPAAFMEIDRYADELDRAARAFVEGRRIKVGGKAIRSTPHSQPLVIMESPYAGDIAANESYARACLLDCLRRGEAPIASHLLHTQVLDDMQPDERELGIEAGLAWYRVADKCVVYADRGVSGGMAKGIERANRYGVPVEYRTLNEGQVAA